MPTPCPCNENDPDDPRVPVVIRTANKMARHLPTTTGNPGTTTDPTGPIGGGNVPLPPDLQQILDNVP